MEGGLLNLFGINPAVNRKRRENTQDLEKQIAAQILMQRMRGEQGLAEEGKRGETQIANIKEQRITAAQEALAKLTQTEREQMLGIMSKNGVMYSPQNKEVFDQELTDPTIRGLSQRQATENRILASPGYQKSAEAGMNASALAPVFGNIRTGTIPTREGDVNLIPPSGAEVPPPISAFPMMQGMGRTQTVEPTTMDFPQANGQTLTIPGQPKVLQGNTPPKLRLPVNPQILNAASQLGGNGGGTSVPPIPPISALGGSQPSNGAIPSMMGSPAVSAPPSNAENPTLIQEKQQQLLQQIIQQLMLSKQKQVGSNGLTPALGYGE